MKTGYVKALEDVAEVAERLVTLRSSLRNDVQRHKNGTFSEDYYKLLMRSYHRDRCRAEKSLDEVIERLGNFPEWQVYTNPEVTNA